MKRKNCNPFLVNMFSNCSHNKMAFVHICIGISSFMELNIKLPTCHAQIDSFSFGIDIDKSQSVRDCSTRWCTHVYSIESQPNIQSPDTYKLQFASRHKIRLNIFRISAENEREKTDRERDIRM